MSGEATLAVLGDEGPAGEAVVHDTGAITSDRAGPERHEAPGYLRDGRARTRIRDQRFRRDNTRVMPDALSISYGPGLPGEAELRLCGDVSGRRVVELGGVHNAVAVASLGGHAIAVSPSADEIARGRELAERAEVRVEFHHADLADLGFATSASVDLVVSAGALGRVDDLARVVRQVHRILKPEMPFVFSVPHPVAGMLEGGEVVLRRAYGADGRTISAYYMALFRANFRVETLIEPPPVDHPSSLVPAGLLVRARKEGV
jgi:SAM-dependent methyltransferase